MNALAQSIMATSRGYSVSSKGCRLRRMVSVAHLCVAGQRKKPYILSHRNFFQGIGFTRKVVAPSGHGSENLMPTYVIQRCLYRMCPEFVLDETF